MDERIMQPRYSMLIEWSDMDQAYIVSLPEWEGHVIAHTHGETYAEAAQRGEELLDFLVVSTPDAERPAIATYDAHAYAPGETEKSMRADIKRLVREIEQHRKEHDTDAR